MYFQIKYVVMFTKMKELNESFSWFFRLELKSEQQKKIMANNLSSQSWQESKGSIKERTSCLVNSERLSDITFLVGVTETPIFGHKTILSAGSPYFEKLFFGPMATKESVHKISDLEPEVFLGFLKVFNATKVSASLNLKIFKHWFYGVFSICTQMNLMKQWTTWMPCCS